MTREHSRSAHPARFSFTRAPAFSGLGSGPSLYRAPQETPPLSSANRLIAFVPQALDNPLSSLSLATPILLAFRPDIAHRYS